MEGSAILTVGYELSSNLFKWKRLYIRYYVIAYLPWVFNISLRLLGGRLSEANVKKRLNIYQDLSVSFLLCIYLSVYLLCIFYINKFMVAIIHLLIITKIFEKMPLLIGREKGV